MRERERECESVLTPLIHQMAVSKQALLHRRICKVFFVNMSLSAFLHHHLSGEFTMTSKRAVPLLY